MKILSPLDREINKAGESAGELQRELDGARRAGLEHAARLLDRRLVRVRRRILSLTDLRRLPEERASELIELAEEYLRTARLVRDKELDLAFRRKAARLRGHYQLWFEHHQGGRASLEYRKQAIQEGDEQ